MAHYALLNENNIVVKVIVGIDESESINGLTPEEFYGQLQNLKCVRTSYNNRIRKQFAGIGYKYDENDDVFIAPSPYPSWQLDANFDWQPPTPKPNGYFEWNENDQKWDEILDHPLMKYDS